MKQVRRKKRTQQSYLPSVIIVVALVATVILLAALLPTKPKKQNSSNSNNDTAVNTTEATTTITTEATTEAPTPPPVYEVDLIAVGDVLTHMPLNNTYKKGETWDYTGVFTHVKDLIQDADVAVVNQETILGGKELGISGYPNFNAPQELGHSLVSAGFNTILHATNHTLDKGSIGVLNTIKFWKTNYPDITYLGISDVENPGITIKEYNNIKIAMLNYTYSFNGHQLPSNMPYLSNLIDIDKITADVNAAKQVADFIIVFPHWGIEYTHTPVDSQKTLAKQLADLGVDLVIGAHPHVIEPVEIVEGSNGNKTLVYYSLGNFVSNQDRAPRVLGAMADVTIIKDTEGTRIKEYDVIPLVTHYEPTGGHTVYKLSDYTKELAARHRMNYLDSSFSYDYLHNTAKKVFGNLYTTEQ